MNHINTASPQVPAAQVGPPSSPASTVVASASGVSWAAIFAGAMAAASLSLILLILGVGLGFSTVSPWSGEGITASSFGIATILWLTFTQLAASGAGGYLAGRLRTRWAGLHTDEVYFRDTAHGFLAWALATLVTAGVLGSAVATVVGGGAKVGAAAATSSAAAAAAPAAADAASHAGAMTDYFVDMVFRKDTAASSSGSSAAPVAAASAAGAASTRQQTVASPLPSAEVARIFASAVASGALPAEDGRYVGQLVAQQTGMSQAEAEKRVTDSFNRLLAKTKEIETQAKEAADKARKAATYAALWFFVSLLIGAFVASWVATLGGRQRDRL